MQRPFVSARGTVAAGALTTNRARNCRLYREGAGVYWCITSPGFNARADEFDPNLQVIGATAVIGQLGNTGSGTPPGGAAAAAGSLAYQLLFFDAAGAAVDPAGFTFSLSRL